MPEPNISTVHQDILKIADRKMLSNPSIACFGRSLSKKQQPDGFFRSCSAVIYNTFFFVGILRELGARPGAKTVEYVRSLQAGRFGFSESPGQVPWTDKTMLALKMFGWLGLVPEEKEKMSAFFRQMQNRDGGFGSISMEASNPLDAFWTLEILGLLGTMPADSGGAIRWVKGNMAPHSIGSAYRYLACLSMLGSGPDNAERDRCLGLLNAAGSFEDEFQRLSALELLGIKENPAIEADCGSVLSLMDSSPSEAYFALLLAIKRGVIAEPVKIVRKALGMESASGGFCSPGEVYTIKNGFAAHSLSLLGMRGHFDSTKFVSWLNGVSNGDGWGAMPGAPTYSEYTTTSLTALHLLGEDISSLPVKKGILKRASVELGQLSGAAGNYNYLRTAKNIIEQWRLFGVEAQDSGALKKGILSFQNADGGFGHPNFSYMYATYWAVRSLYLLSHGRSGSSILREEPKRFGIAQWIGSCCNRDGGFGPARGGPSNIQATYLAVCSMAMLGFYPGEYGKTLAWAVERMEEETVAEELLNSLYLVGTAALLYDAAQRKRIDTDPGGLEKQGFVRGAGYALHIDMGSATEKELDGLGSLLGSLQGRGTDFITTQLPRCAGGESNKRQIFSSARPSLGKCNDCVYSLRGLCSWGAR